MSMTKIKFKKKENNKKKEKQPMNVAEHYHKNIA